MQLMCALVGRYDGISIGDAGGLVGASDERIVPGTVNAESGRRQNDHSGAAFLPATVRGITNCLPVFGTGI